MDNFTLIKIKFLERENRAKGISDTVMQTVLFFPFAFHYSGAKIECLFVTLPNQFYKVSFLGYPIISIHSQNSNFL